MSDAVPVDEAGLVGVALCLKLRQHISLEGLTARTRILSAERAIALCLGAHMGLLA